MVNRFGLLFIKLGIELFYGPEEMNKMGKSFVKSVSILVCIILVSGCGVELKEPDLKIVANMKKTNEETFRKFLYAKYPVEKIKLEFSKKSEIKPPKQKGNLPEFKLEEWSPKPLEYKGRLIKKWTIKAEKSKSMQDYMYYESMPDGWIVRPNRETIPDTFDKIINPQDCSVVRSVEKYVWQGKICGKYLFHTTANRGCPPLECTDMTNWSTGWISNIEAMTGDQQVMVADGCLVVGIFAAQFNIQRINHRIGETMWNIYNISGVDSAFCYKSFNVDKNIFVLGEYLYDDSNFVRLILIKINPNDGSYECRDVYSYNQDHSENDSYWSNANYVISNGKILLHCGDSHLLIINPDTMAIEKDIILPVPAMSKMITVGNKLVCIDWWNGEKGNWMFDLNNLNNHVKLNKDIAIFNNQMMTTTSKRINQIVDEKMNTGWYIDLVDVGLDKENAVVFLQDWRGVLLVTDKELICFGKP